MDAIDLRKPQLTLTAMASQKPLVAVLGATGNTGKSITNALLASDNFVRLAIRIMPPPRTELTISPMLL